MKTLIVLSLAVACVLAESPYLGYHDRVGIPLAARILEAETAAIQSGSRIIGGEPAPLGAHPYLVGVVTHFGGSYSACGSSMLSNTRVITAAHCWWDFWRQTERFTLVFGSEYIFFGGTRVDTTDVEMHPGWDGLWALEYDIAIVRFPDVAYTNVIQPIALPSGALESNSFVGTWAQASGWGIIGDGIPPTTNQLHRHVTLQVISNDVCRQSFPTVITERIICTSGVGLIGPVGICSSDSGGPLSIVNNNQRVLIGVVSFGSGSCESGAPSGYVRVTEHLPWIRERI